jgi:hypothetical protein
MRFLNVFSRAVKKKKRQEEKLVNLYLGDTLQTSRNPDVRSKDEMTLHWYV